MAIIKPFCAIRPKKELASQIAALPYDVYNRKEACEKVKGDSYSFLRIDRAETQFGDEVDTYDDRVYAKAKELLEEQIAKGDYIADTKPCFYLYELTMNGRSQTGIVACASIDDYANNIIKKHENTRADKEIDRIRHVDTLNAQTGPIFLAYRDRDDLKAVVDKCKNKAPVYDFVSDDGIGHRAFLIDDAADIETISHIFSTMDSIYIADGHHRCASAAKVGFKRREENPGYTGEEEFNYFLSVLFPDSELMIMDYNRVVKDLNGLSDEAFLNKVKEIFDVKECGDEVVKPENKGQFGMYLNNKGYLLSVKEKDLSTDPVEGLDVSILQNLLLDPVLGIKDPKTDKRIDFVGGIRGLSELKKRTNSDMKVAFSMYPTSIGELFAVADAKLLMPPKSTWFEPKLRSGLFIHSIK